MDSRYTARLIALGRIGLGLSLLLVPGVMARMLDLPSTSRLRLVVRVFAVRDLALGAGAYHALSEGTPAAGWVRAGAAADAVDAAAVLLAAGELGPAKAAAGTAVAGAAAAVGFRAAADVDA